ncbi:hypothetical protein D9619_005992 [Psilocybe cf. subviscida]|uniref:Isochorismatase-like domain-containing protein n=1 Tax=Psilocybe cf. subviscida TaxID=2480587 RepID=A0A8H5BX92_9AGAR|nr:hypothetical protein D9619_005992 [Psilocybe cf. subviscida]
MTIALLIIDSQKGFDHPTYWGPARSNPKYEENITALLATFRALPENPLIIHVQHHSRLEEWLLHPSKPTCEFMHYTYPDTSRGELVITKRENSAFIGTDLEKILRERNVKRIYMAGLTTDHCVSTTTRMAANLGITRVAVKTESGEEELREPEGLDGIVFVQDATACWQKPDGKWDAETVHSVHVESLKEFARIADTREVVGELGTN